MKKMTRRLGRPVVAGGLLAATLLSGSMAAGADPGRDGRFSDFTPLTRSAGPTADESKPITLSSTDFEQESIIARKDVLATGTPTTGSTDMNTLNETGRQKGRFLFTVFETGQSGVQRHDLKTGKTETVWIAPKAGDAASFDASYWTPWGTYITAEESWCTSATGCTTSIYGRLFELTNPLSAPGIKEPVGAASNAGAQMFHRNIIPRTAHEGIQFDRDWNMYFVDELNGGAIYKYTSAARKSEITSGRKGYFDAGQVFVLRAGDGNTPNATGNFSWVPLTDRKGTPLPGTLSITDANGVTSLDARNTVNLAPFKATDYQRPEDLQIQTVNGREYLYVATTTTHEVYRLDLGGKKISVFANRSSIDLATGVAVGGELTAPDNLAIDSKGNIYIVEDEPGGVSDDIWFAKDLNKDGDLTDPGEGLGRWASNGTVGSEFTGLYFDPFNADRAWVNIQHPDSGNDRTIEITVDAEHSHGRGDYRYDD